MADNNSPTKPSSASNASLSPEDVIEMPLAEFGERFGFRPVDALEKKFFAVTGSRPSNLQRAAIEAGVLGEMSNENAVME